MSLLIIENLLIKETTKIPIYEYTCMECDEDTEITRGFNDQEEVPSCTNGHKMVRSYTAPGIQFKGSGFYKTDNG